MSIGRLDAQFLRHHLDAFPEVWAQVEVIGEVQAGDGTPPGVLVGYVLLDGKADELQELGECRAVEDAKVDGIVRDVEVNVASAPQREHDKCPLAVEDPYEVFKHVVSVSMGMDVQLASRQTHMR